MCVSVPVMIAASTAVQAVGAIQQGRAQSAAARYNAQVAEGNAATAEANSQFIARTARETAAYNAAVAEADAQKAAWNADAAAIDGATAEALERDRNDRVRAALRAGVAKAGVRMSGSAADVLDDQVARDELAALRVRYDFQMEERSWRDASDAATREAAMIRRQGEIDATQATLTGQAQARDFRAQAQLDRFAGRQAMTSAVFSAAGSILSGGTSYARFRAGQQNPPAQQGNRS